MTTFKDLGVHGNYIKALKELQIKVPTEIQEKTIPVLLKTKTDYIGLAQTGTGKTAAYGLPILNSIDTNSAVVQALILSPTRELVQQVVEQIALYSKYVTVRTIGVYGGTNINTQALTLKDGVDILVATPGRLYDMVIARMISLKSVKKLVIDEVDVMLDLGFIFQLTNIFELLPERRQNIMFSATMTEDVDLLIKDFFYDPIQISIAVSGTPLENIAQVSYEIPNFYSKVNLLEYLLDDAKEFSKVLIFAPTKKMADRLQEAMLEHFGPELGIIHSNKTQNTRNAAIENFNNGQNRILIATDVIARGLDLDKISHVINFDTPKFPENYMHRIGRTGRAEEMGKTILLFSEKELPAKEAIETLMGQEIAIFPLPEEVVISKKLIPEEMPQQVNIVSGHSLTGENAPGPAFHDKSAKNSKVNLGSRYKREIVLKYKKPLTRGDKNQNRRKK
ncbi:MAG TPA: DEAD/DEAH box helicase [Flavobacteriales bacterium]|nr:DEAD/DEAH box helicase [Flavobacteriales bacterium]